MIVLNIGKGGEELLPGSEQQLDTQVELQKNRIVNLSLEYSDDTDQTVQAIFSKMMFSGEENQNLFVVAAGNDSDADVISAPYYPAAFGGNGLNRTANVISVAAHLPSGALASFSNRRCRRGRPGRARVRSRLLDRRFGPGCQAQRHLPGGCGRHIRGSAGPLTREF